MRRSRCAPVLLVLCLLTAGLTADEMPGQLARNLRTALDEGFEIGAGHLQVAQQVLGRIESVAPREPRVAFAAGLILYKQMHTREAIREFERATQSQGAPYWPAWKAWTWIAFQQELLEAGGRRLESLARKAAEHPDDEAREALVWSGQVLGAIQRTRTDPRSQDLLIDAENRIRALLDDELEEALDEGLVRVNEDEDRLRAKDEERARQVQTRRAVQTGSTLANVQQLQVKASTAREAANRSAEEWKRWHDETVAQIDKLLAVRESEYLRLQKEAASLQQSIFLAQQEYASIQSQRLQLDPQSRPNASRAAVLQSWELEQQRLRYETELLAVQVRQLQTAQEGLTCMNQRCRVVEQYERATGAISEAKSKVDAWSDRLAARENVARGALNTLAPVKRRAVSFARLVPFDFEAARRQLLKDIQAP